MNLYTERLILNSFLPTDAGEVASFTDSKNLTQMTTPLSYAGDPVKALSWISSHKKEAEINHNFIFAIRLKQNSKLIGCINIGLNETKNRGFIGFWIGEDYWNKGFASEATSKIIEYGFEKLGLQIIWSGHYSFNQASANVLNKFGMSFQEVKEKCLEHESKLVDMHIRPISRKDFYTHA